MPLLLFHSAQLLVNLHLEVIGGAAKLGQEFADLPPDFRQLLRPEEDQGKQEDHNGVGKVHCLS